MERSRAFLTLLLSIATASLKGKYNNINMTKQIHR